MGAAGDADLIKGYPCTSCGASLEFAPGTTSMECPYCGAQNEIAAAVGIVALLEVF